MLGTHTQHKMEAFEWQHPKQIFPGMSCQFQCTLAPSCLREVQNKPTQPSQKMKRNTIHGHAKMLKVLGTLSKYPLEQFARNPESSTRTLKSIFQVQAAYRLLCDLQHTQILQQQWQPSTLTFVEFPRM